MNARLQTVCVCVCVCVGVGVWVCVSVCVSVLNLRNMANTDTVFIWQILCPIPYAWYLRYSHVIGSEITDRPNSKFGGEQSRLWEAISCSSGHQFLRINGTWNSQ